MEKEFVECNEALALKELGFDEPCFGFYNDMENNKPIGGNFPCDGRNSAPLYQQAFSFFRDKYKLEGVVQQAEDFKWYKWKISQYNEDGKKYVADWYEYKTHEEAELACLVMLIDIVKLYK